MTDEPTVPQVSVSFISEENTELGGSGILVPIDISKSQLQILCNQLLGNRYLCVIVFYRFFFSVMIRYLFRFSQLKGLKF